MYHGQSPTAVPPPQWQTIILPHNITKLTTVNCVHSSHETAAKRDPCHLSSSQAILESLLFGEPLLKTENILDHVFPFGQFVSDATSTPHTGQTWAQNSQNTCHFEVPTIAIMKKNVPLHSPCPREQILVAMAKWTSFEHYIAS
jgi:hypothetical protein